jgi:enamine deaminase RidA (YjgF/YER057c/UK114 family)
VQNVDVNYGGVVKARRENFIGQGLTEHTHYIASTGIEGRDANPAIQVLMDAYAVDGLAEQQIKYLHALTHLNPTYEYGVTFERGVSIEYGDRKQLYISGTASINNKGLVLHAGNVTAQTQRVWENVEKLLEEGGAAFCDVMQMIVYLRDISDYRTVSRLFNERFPEIPKHYVLAPVCRSSWLIEMECIATKANNNEAFADL